MKLADQLTSSDRCNWLDEVAKLDKAHKARASAWYMHYVLEQKGPMQKNYDRLYLKHKQSMHRRWKSDLDLMHWVHWESTDEYDTDVDATTEELHGTLQARVEQMQSLEAAQLPEAVIAEVVMHVVAPMVATMLTPEDMDMTGAGPGTTSMGPGTPVPSEDMSLVLDADEQIKQW